MKTLKYINKTKLLKQLKDLNIRPKKSLGQSFLINPLISEQIVSIIKNLKPQSLVEIGPGLGSLTYPLSQLNIPLTLVELDSKMAEFWKQKKFSVIEKNALQLHPSQTPASCTLVGNLPYQISNRLIIQASIYWPVRQMCLMVQKETAERMIAVHKQKSYGFLSVAVQYTWNIQKMLEVPVFDFHPQPQVEGVVLTFKRKNILPSALAKFIKECFQQKRKFLLKKIGNMQYLWLHTSLSKASQIKYIQQSFDKLNIPLKARAEELSVDQFVKLYQHLIKDSHVSKNYSSK